MKKLVIFDLDGTVAESKSAVDVEMAALLDALLAIVKVAIISGGDWPQFEKQLLPGLPHDERLKNLSLLPTAGTKFYQYKTDWKQLYAEKFNETEKKKITDALTKAITLSGFADEQIWGAQIEDRGSQITFSALGQQAPTKAKKMWDPDFSRRQKMKAVLEEIIPGYSIHLGGTTSVDVTRQGIDKAYGIGKLRDMLGITIEQMLFVGDALFPGGNDYPVMQAGVVSIHVRDPNETKRVIETILACLKDG